MAKSETTPTEDERADEVTVCWGEEKFNAGDYNNFSAGVVYVKTVVREGESVEDAGERAYKSAEAVGEWARERKKKAFVQALREVRSELRAKG